MLTTSPLPMIAGLRAHGDAPALITDDQVISFRELADRIEPGPPQQRRLVAIGIRNDADSVIAYLAALAAGHAVLLAPPCRLQQVARGIGPGPHDLHPDLALLLSTSGSTGSAKLVRLSYENVRSNASAIAQYLSIRPTDRVLTTLPLHYCYGLSVLHSHLLAGAAIRLTAASVTDPGFPDLLTGVTTLPGVPHTFELLEAAGVTLPDTLRTMTCAGGRMAPGSVRSWAQRGQAQGFDLFVMYGQTEATARMLYLPPDLAAEHPSSVGVPIPGGGVRIDDGELVYTGPNVMMGYAQTGSDLARPAELAELRTGDLARINDAGLVEITGRRSRFVKVCGLRVDLAGVEAELAEQDQPVWCLEGDGCLQAACLSDPDGTRALLCRVTGLPPSVIRVQRITDLPRTASGKPDYPALRAAFAAEEVPPEGVIQLVAAVLRRDPGTIGAQDSFVSLGGDSLSYVAVAAALEQRLGTLPRDWHRRPLADLEPGPRRRGLRHLETTAVLRAVAILAVVASHVGVADIRGGAHLLLAIAGYNFARFRLGGDPFIRPALASVARIALPAGAYLTAVAAFSTEYGAAVVFGTNLFGPDGSAPEWRYWYLESLVLILLAAIAAIGLGHGLQRRWPYGFALGAVGVGLLARWTFVAPDGPGALYTPAVVLWLFAVGWALAQARTRAQTAAVLGLLGLGMVGYFADPWRAAFVLAGIALVAMRPTLPVPAVVAPTVIAVAGASLWIYLTHWQTYPPLASTGWVAVAVALVVGLLAQRAADRVTARMVGP